MQLPKLASVYRLPFISLSQLIFYLKILIFCFILELFNLFISGCAGSLRLCRLFSSCSAQASHCSGFSCCRAWARGCAVFSSCGSQALDGRLNSCGPWAQLPIGIWDLPGSGIKPVTPALQGEFLTPGPPEKPLISSSYRTPVILDQCPSQRSNSTLITSLKTLSPNTAAF